MINIATCPLCHAAAGHFVADTRRDYYQCSQCELVFADPTGHLEADAERAVYDLHENLPDDAGYRNFLEQLTVPLLARLTPGMQGLDFGCGPGPTLHLMLEERGMNMQLYDIFYQPNKQQLQRQYDFVTSTEVVEHFYQPAATWRQLVDLVKPGGTLAIMTSLFTRQTPAAFLAWQYKNDPTHVSFYTPWTMKWLAQEYALNCDILSQRVIFFQRLPVHSHS
ncbi:class I SAM-dependent methyltransferase [Pseudidiomarina insulisalsae]|uniref:2-polyprenyl-3-methyl-5-hydroxy-6-metoxy-1, 4-benzoquinol methylase n=1 Tax=Pseudidiomarina insulisalsae TaxID=575789 RepID=A0A432YPS7_9GAMM|nr:class I SAM-dependent methyltransferase [Pseudidiomarina insulisalsae]RUO63130.1 2-polyprenyl-3-methyl-5-hydroxy-6-metoxy-1,4-benzoquinol methylase [Pseudidiomarina insulisalsae]